MADIDIDLQSGSLIFSGSNMSLINSNLIGFSIGDTPYDSQTTYLADELNTRTFDAWPFDQTAYGLNTFISGSLTNNLPLDWPLWSISGWRSPFYLDDYYYRIHLSTSTLNLGNVLSEQSYTIKIWNAYLTSQALSTIANYNTDGIVLTYPNTLPDTYYPLEELSFNVSVGVAGQATIDGGYTFTFPEQTLNLAITGQRVILWPFAPQREFTETKEWLTDVITARGKETRDSIRPIPRRILSYSYRFREQKELAVARTIAKSAVHVPMATPLWTDVVKLTNLTSGLSTLTFSTANLELEAGSIIVLWQSYDNYEILEVTNVTGSNISLKLPTVKAWDYCYLLPLYTGIVDGIDLSKNVNKLGAKANFKITNNFNLASWTPTETFKSLPVFTTGNVLSEGLEEKLIRHTEEFDNEIGGIVVFNIENYTRHQQILAIYVRTRAELHALRRFLDYLKGRYQTFWLPSFMADLKAADVISVSGNSLKVYSGQWSTYGVEAIRVYGSQIENFQVTGAVDNGDGTETLAFDAISTNGITGIYKIEVLTKVRLNNDSVDINHTSKGIASIKTQVISVKA